MRRRKTILEEIGAGLLVLLLVVLFFGSMAVLLSSCAREEWRVPMALPDSTATTRLLRQLPRGKYKFTGSVTFTLATAPGAVATSTSTDNRKAGQKGGAAATAPDAVATATTKKAGVPWWVFVLVAIVGAVGWAWLRSQFSFLSFPKR
ncbi:hypothetical protein [Hymenobacter terricola]|uniref:hypothetical protein n=1 Tax=Hymenobacter terricola TaxID=2819236 RepID=UPI001B309EFF|nr:hypothetical protein [Hymenobacter terricola]